jgi:hypothetical protein
MALSSCLGSSHSFLCYLWVRKHLDSIFELQQKWNEKISSYFSFALVQLVGRGSEHETPPIANVLLNRRPKVRRTKSV